MEHPGSQLGRHGFSAVHFEAQLDPFEIIMGCPRALLDSLRGLRSVSLRFLVLVGAQREPPGFFCKVLGAHRGDYRGVQINYIIVLDKDKYYSIVLLSTTSQPCAPTRGAGRLRSPLVS